MTNINSLTLDAQEDSKIKHLSLYTHQAQLTRIFTVNILSGQNKVKIIRLPNVVDHESIRVEVVGPAIIQGVTALKAEMAEPEETSPLLESLIDEREKAESALARCKKAVGAIDTYIGKLDIQHLDVSKLGEAMDIYDSTEEKWDAKIAETTKRITRLEEQIGEERERLESVVPNKKLRTEVRVDLHGSEAAEIEIVLTYAVSHSEWTPSYDLRVTTQADLLPVKLTYKATISQKTGEIWKDAPITLETSQPTFGLQDPVLNTWYITHAVPSLGGRPMGKGGAMRHRKILPDEDDLDFTPHQTADVTSRGHVVATYRIPGETTIPSDEEEHTVTVSELSLPGTLSWICIPKYDVRVHMKANVKNDSEYTFLPGSSNIFVDGSFISRSQIPSVSPGEGFECPLGIDPSIRVTYHPKTHVPSQSGFYQKSKKHTFSQQITVHNAKPVPVDGIRITDNIPVSQDADITVNLLKPGLVRPRQSTDKYTLREATVSSGVVAQWHGAENPDTEKSVVDQHGKVDWICAIPAMDNVNLLLQWEVITTKPTEAIGGLF